jgi:ubiquinone/menaquinone biosynthesis C-methylase UbiE
MPGRIYDATWGRIFAACYDRFLAPTEEAGLRAARSGLLAGASGRTIDLGAGTGLNLEHYPDAVSELVLAEPDPHMIRRLRTRVAESGRPVKIVQTGAEQLPFDEDSFDTAVFTLVLCTVPDPAAALAETARVLRPGGRMLFLEHVRSPETGLARWQDRLHGAWKLFGDGCNCNRDTLAAIEASPLEVESVERGEIPKAVPLVKPRILGSAAVPR